MDLVFKHLARDMESVYRSDIVLSNAQVLALPTTPVVIIPAPGGGKVIHPLSITYRIDTTAGAYTNSSAIGTTQISYEGITSQFINNGLRLNSQLTAAQQSWVEEPLIAFSRLLSDVENKGLTFAYDNQGSGVFTGGNAANGINFMINYAVIFIR